MFPFWLLQCRPKGHERAHMGAPGLAPCRPRPLLRLNFLSNRFFQKLEDVQGAMLDAWNASRQSRNGQGRVLRQPVKGRSMCQDFRETV